MKVQVEFITARLNGKVLFVEAIQDCYTEVQIIIPKEDLDVQTTNVLEKNSFVYSCQNSFNLGCYEAKDLVGNYGNLVVAIESREIDFE